MPEQSPQKDLPERALECSACKKAIAIRYTEIVGETINEISMCADCPELIRRLYGTQAPLYAGAVLEGGAGLCCGSCGMSWGAVKTGNALGCPECYEVFSDLILSEMSIAGRISPRASVNKKSIPLHIGMTPGEKQEINPSLQLLALNEALKETLSREDYEQAAWIRDKIRDLTEGEQLNEGKGPNEGGK